MYDKTDLQETKWRMKMGPKKVSMVKENRTLSNYITKLTLITALIFVGSTTTSTIGATGSTSYLKSVSITDAAGDNAPPTAVINYSRHGDIVTFDASQSSDTDGSIIAYKWKIADGTAINGETVNHTITRTDPIAVTLEATDNQGGVCITQKSITGTLPPFLLDNFNSSTETSIQNHSPEIGGTWHVVYDSQQILNTTTATIKNLDYGGTLFYNKAVPEDPDYTVKSHVRINHYLRDRLAGPCLRVTSTGDGYCAYLQGDSTFNLSKHDNNSIYGITLSKQILPNINTSKDEYIISISAKGSSLEANIMNVNKELITTITGTDTTFTSAGYPGAVIRRNSSLIHSTEASGN